MTGKLWNSGAAICYCRAAFDRGDRERLSVGAALIGLRWTAGALSGQTHNWPDIVREL